MMNSPKALISVLLALCAVTCFAEDARWIFYPGDLGVYLGEKVQARRPEWNGNTPVMWPQYHHWTVVEFAKDVDLSEPEEVDVRACGTGTLRWNGQTVTVPPHDTVTLCR